MMRFAFTALLALGSSAAPATAAPPEAGAERLGPVITRIFFQDRERNALRWADVRGGKTPTLGAVGDVAGFPKLDPERQGLVQMEAVGGYLLVGVRDDSDGAFGSGWVLVSTGVEEEEHGDHSHWRYKSAPSVRQVKIDAEQGNPAHLYEYGGIYYLANDTKDGYTRIDPKAVPTQGEVPAAFHPGGSGHITIAVSNGFGYGTWIDGGGPNAGRVDVTPVKPEGGAEIVSSFSLPTGVIHGATAAADKIFFAPADGICWISADDATASPEVRHLPLSTDPASEKPLRTGAFAVHRDRVLFVTGRGEEAVLGLLDARAAEPEVVTLKLDAAEGLKPVTPTCVRTGKKHYGLVFLDAPEPEEGEDRLAESLAVVDLDPNGDGDYRDAAVAKTLPIGASAVEGHNGHHSVAVDAPGRRGFVANPGEGTVSLIDLYSLEPVRDFAVGGKPESILAVGGRASNH